MKTALVNKINRDGTEEKVSVKIGDYVGFKSDIEQGGRIVEIRQSDRWSPVEFLLSNPDGFQGDYLRYATQALVAADDCWIA